MCLRRSETRLDRTRPHLSMRGSLTHQMKGKFGKLPLARLKKSSWPYELDTVRKLGQSVIARIGSGKQDQRSLSSGSAKAEASEKGFHLLVTWWPPCAKIFKEHRNKKNNGTETKKTMVISSCANSLSLSLSVGRDCPHANSIR